MRFLIVGDSPDFEHDTVLRLALPGVHVVALDGAALKLPSGISPEIVCGDFDSLDTSASRKRFPGAEHTLLEDQNENDLEKAIRLALQRGAQEIMMCCVLGGLPDQHSANLSVIHRHHESALLRAFHRGMECRVASPNRDFRAKLPEGKVVSTIPAGEEVRGSISGVRWPLTDGLLRMGSHGVSNVSLGGDVEVSPTRGAVFVFFEA